MTKLQKLQTQYVALLLVLALVMLLVPKISAAEYSTSGAITFRFTDSGITASGGTAGYEIDGTALTIKASAPTSSLARAPTDRSRPKRGRRA